MGLPHLLPIQDVPKEHKKHALEVYNDLVHDVLVKR
jgi:hypothetical protein